jgi:transcriptional regulator with XRE-family HTH domain
VAAIDGQRLRELRKAKGYESQELLARALGVSWSTVNRYERGDGKPSMNRVWQIADLLGVDPAELLVADGAAA